MAAHTYKTAMAVGAHPDDIEFLMAGTLLKLKEAGLDIHMWNFANGYCGTATMTREEIIAARWAEAQEAARDAGATLHKPVVDDLAIIYDLDLLAKASAVIREVKPDILLLPSLQDYMEDHQTTGRLLVTAAFARAMMPYKTSPRVDPWGGDVFIYHAMPSGLRDQMRKLVRGGQYVDVSPQMDTKRTMLAKHRSQKEWLDVSQGMDSYIIFMEGMCRDIGAMSGRFEYAEGWRRHSHLGFSGEDKDPLTELLGPACWVDPEYENSLG